MHPDLERLIQLQQLETSAEQARRRITEAPELEGTFEARLSEKQAAVAGERERLAASQAARREIEKQLAIQQARLAKFKDQLMEVKTNKEYQAMQKEIAVAEREVSSHEDRILERMEEADALTAAFKRAEAALATEQAAVAAERQALQEELRRLEADLERNATLREALLPQLSDPALRLFNHVFRQRKGLAMAEARGGICTVCHVRLRPQVLNDVRRNDSLLQCESCNRILYFVPTPAPAGSPEPSPGGTR
jgi:hypothetical protein